MLTGLPLPTHSRGTPFAKYNRSASESSKTATGVVVVAVRIEERQIFLDAA
jgi:hypothetical protein